MLIWKAIAIICIIIVLFLLGDKLYSTRENIVGIWSATPSFCTKSGLSSFMIKFNKRLKDGFAVMVGSDQKSILCNTAFNISGWKFIPSTRVEESLTFEFEDPSPIPESCDIEIIDKVLIMTSEGKLYGEFTKIS
jgi:hypothetical protein